MLRLIASAPILQNRGYAMAKVEVFEVNSLFWCSWSPPQQKSFENHSLKEVTLRFPMLIKPECSYTGFLKLYHLMPTSRNYLSNYKAWMNSSRSPVFERNVFQKGIKFENVTGIGKKLFLTSRTAIDKGFTKITQAHCDHKAGRLRTKKCRFTRNM